MIPDPRRPIYAIPPWSLERADRRRRGRLAVAGFLRDVARCAAIVVVGYLAMLALGLAAR